MAEFDTIQLTLSFFYSFIHIMTVFLYITIYSKERKDKKYATIGRASVLEMPLSRRITKVAFIWGSFLVLLSFWIKDSKFGFLQPPHSLRITGLFLTFLSYLILKDALRQLGVNYSPIFDTHKPHFIVTAGMYKVIRHPVYLCNMMILLGFVLSGTSIWVIASSLWGWGYMIYSIKNEDDYLTKEFPEYSLYKKKTWRIIPYLY